MNAAKSTQIEILGQRSVNVAKRVKPQRIRLYGINPFRIFLVTYLVSLMSAYADISYELVTVGNPINAADSTSYGRVDYYYRIGKYEVSIAQYTVFLNAVAAMDTYGLYNTNMATDASIAGIVRSGSSGSYTYSIIGNGSRPISYVSWFDAARMANWMHNGQPTGAQDSSTTESGAYTLNGATSGIINKNAGALVFIPSENEWFKAAYYDPSLSGGAGGYWLYPTRTNSSPGNVVGGLPNQVNYYTADSAPSGILSVTQRSYWEANQNYLTPAGAFSNSASSYGTFDQGGNVYEFTDGVSSSSRVRRGGTWWANNSGALLQLQKGGSAPAGVTDENGMMGFRLATVANPEIVVEQPAANSLTDGSASVLFDTVTLSNSVVKIFTIHNMGFSPLTGLSNSCDGVNSGDFLISPLGATTLAAGQSANFTVTFTPAGLTSGNRNAVLHLSSNDADEGSFDIALSGVAFSTTADLDEDGLNDWAEYQLSPLGFDWQTPQASLVAALTNGANAAGFYSLSQVQTLNVDTLLLTRDAGGNCKLTIGLQKTVDLSAGFTPFPFLSPQTTVNPQGQLEFSFEAPDNSAFFRLEAH
jgi:formylglycine-generating enzyme required for sulfatase activity